MAFRWIEVIAPRDCRDAICDAAREAGISEIVMADAEGETRMAIRLLAGEIDRQDLIDRLQDLLDGQDGWRIVLTDTAAVTPVTEEERDLEQDRDRARAEEQVHASREEIYQRVGDGASFGVDFVALVALSTVVASAGMLRGDTAVVIGGMVIAPLLGPLLALGFGVAVGDRGIVVSALRTAGLGLVLSVGFAFLLGLVVGIDVWMPELVARTRPDPGSAILALASGAAAALSVAMPVASGLVGVMVAVALLPPAATVGLCLAQGQLGMAGGAGLLLAVNLVSVALATVVTFLLRGIRPRRWHERKGAEQSQRLTVIGLGLALLALVALAWAVQRS